VILKLEKKKQFVQLIEFVRFGPQWILQSQN